MASVLHAGHAGYAASELRDLSDRGVKDADIDEKELVETLLSSPAMFKHVCKEHFDKYDDNKNGLLDFDEIRALTSSLYKCFGLEAPAGDVVEAFFKSCDANQDGVLCEAEFQAFFESFLRHAFFQTDKLRKIVEDSNKPR